MASQYTRVPIQDSISLKSELSQKDVNNNNSNLNKGEEPSSKLMVIFSVLFYLVAATTSKFYILNFGFKLLFEQL